MTLQPGDTLPSFSLTAAVSGITVDRAWLAGRRAVLVVHGSKSTEAAKTVSKALRSQEPDAAKVAFASIVDLRAFPGIWKKVAEAQMKSSYAKLAEKAAAAGLKPEEHVVICPDWDGAVCQALGVPEPDRYPAVIVVASDGTVQQCTMGSDLAQALAGL